MKYSWVLIVPLLAGCAGFNQAMEYTGVPTINRQGQNDTYRIFDKPNEGRLMITPSIGAAAKGGVQSGLTLGASRPRTNLEDMERTSLEYLASTGRACTITQRDEILPPQWELKYRC